MSPHPLSQFLLERWFVEFEFVPGIRNFGGDTQQFEEGLSIMLDELLRWGGRYHM